MAALLFQYVWKGPTWKLQAVRNVFLAGIVGTALPACLLFFFDDKRTLDAVSEAVPRRSSTKSSTLSESQPLINTVSEEEKGSDKVVAFSNCCGCGISSIPWLLAFSDLMFCLGQGMTVKYFFIYFQDVVLLSPTTAMISSAIGTAAAALFSQAAGRLSRTVGRVQSLIVFRLGGVGAMIALGFFSHDATHPDACHRHNSTRHNGSFEHQTLEYETFGPWPGYTPPLQAEAPLSMWQIGVIALFVAQTGFFNSTQPIMKSILMDYVPKNVRGRWSAVDSLTSFGRSTCTHRSTTRLKLGDTRRVPVPAPRPRSPRLRVEEGSCPSTSSRSGSLVPSVYADVHSMLMTSSQSKAGQSLQSLDR